MIRITQTPITFLLLLSSLLTSLTAAHAAKTEIPPGTQALPAKAPEPKDNPSTPAKISLGRKLFFDPRLSGPGTVSCNSCHNVMGSGTDNLATSVGVGGAIGGRSAPTVWNAAFYSVQFWDGRAPTLEEQAKGPITNPIEMGMKSHEAALQRIMKLDDYRKDFQAAFGPGDVASIDNAAKAIAAYERTLLTPNSAFDRFARGDAKALTDSAKRGLKLVQTTGCLSCHQGPIFAGPALPTGTGFYQKFPTFAGSEYEKRYRLTEDTGRHAVTKKEEDRNLWRVPTWRNVALTAPYFHNGAVKSLDEAVRVMAKTQLDKTLQDSEVEDIVAFLNALTGVAPKQELPRLPTAANVSGLD